jgi:hypothetical protein
MGLPEKILKNRVFWSSVIIQELFEFSVHSIVIR